MSEMVGRVASTLATAHMKSLNIQWLYVEMAKAAIAAMRDPSEAMIVAGVHHANMGDMAGRWRAMIDAALADAPS